MFRIEMLHTYILKMEKAYSPETSVYTYKSTRCHNIEDQSEL
jgi:hypothetical protein